MCGRFALTIHPRLLAELFGLAVTPVEMPARYNIAPSQPVAAIAAQESGRGRELRWLRWGLIPHWAKEESMGRKLINARAETVAQKPAFREAFRKQRCLIPADGFYEWQTAAGGKQPYFIHLLTRKTMALAGLWERWMGPGGEAVDSCTIVTAESNRMIQNIHTRMPVILERKNYAYWLDRKNQDAEQLRQLLVPYPAEMMEMYEVCPRVNNPRNEGPRCAEPKEGKQSSESAKDNL